MGNKKYRAGHQEEIARYQRDYYLSHKVESEKYKRTYLGSPKGRLTLLVATARRRAQKKGLPFDLTVGWALEQYSLQAGRCKVTGLLFDLSCNRGRGAYKINPRSPSLDRVDSGKGYTRDNVELVCSHINIAFNMFGRQSFNELAKAYLEYQ